MLKVFPGQKLLVPCPIDENDDVSFGNRRATNQATIASDSHVYSNG